MIVIIFGARHTSYCVTIGLYPISKKLTSWPRKDKLASNVETFFGIRVVLYILIPYDQLKIR